MKTIQGWSKNGVRFECQETGRCCVSRGEYGFVYLTMKDRLRLAEHLGLTVRAFSARYCVHQPDDLWRLREEETREGACIFLEEKRCTVYEGRPTQCRTWPFWPELMNAKSWASEVASFCPGVGKGRVWSPEEIAHVMAEQQRADDEL